MRLRSLFVPLALCACSLVTPTPARADEFADFRIPDNRYLQWTGSLSGTASSSRQTQESRHDASGNENLGMATALGAAWDGEARYSALSASLSLAGLRARSHSEMSLPATLSNGWTRNGSERLGERLDLTWDNRWYPAAHPWWFGARLGATVYDEQSWYRNESEQADRLPVVYRQDQRYSYSTWTYANTQSVRIAVGAGRVRNATGIYEARTLEQRLRAAGALVRPLAPETRMRLAQLMYARFDVSATHERPAEIVWAEIAELLRSDGALRDSVLSAADGVRLVAPYSGSGLAVDLTLLPLSPVTRQRGALVAVVFEGAWARAILRRENAETQHVVYDDTVSFVNEYRNAYRRAESGTRAFAGLSAEFHRPIGLALQFDAATEWLFDVRPGSRGTQESASASLAWIVTDRWLASASVAQQRVLDWRHSSTPNDDDWAVSYGGRIGYHVTDHVDAAFGCTQQHSRTVDPYYYGPGPIFARALRANVGLTYRFAGFANIAGLSPALAP